MSQHRKICSIQESFSHLISVPLLLASLLLVLNSYHKEKNTEMNMGQMYHKFSLFFFLHNGEMGQWQRIFAGLKNIYSLVKFCGNPGKYIKCYKNEGKRAPSKSL